LGWRLVNGFFGVVGAMGWMDGKRWVGVVAVVCLVAGGASLGGCKSAAPAADEAPVEAPAAEVRPGAERWQDHAMELPENSPVVFWARPDALLEGASGVRDWLFARPEMYGPSGEQMVAYVQSQWEQLVGKLGMDPLSSDSWREMGIDPTREIYAAGYPADDEQSETFVAGIEQAVRDKLELGEDVDLADELDQMGIRAHLDAPAGVYKAAAAAVSDVQPPRGIRVVVPVSDSLDFLDSLGDLMRGAEYTGVDVAEDTGEGTQESATHFYHDPSADWPVMMVRVREDLAVIDMVGLGLDAAPAGSRAERSTDELREMLAAEKLRVEAIASGRPAAPKPPGAPILGVAADGEGAATYAKLRGYRIALEQADTASLQERDRVFLRSTHNALLSAGNWGVANAKLSGVSYGLSSGEDAEGFFRLSITLFGAAGDQPLAVNPAPASLGVEQRGLGASLDLRPTEDEAWESWVGVDDPEGLLEYFAAADHDPDLFALSFPRSVALVAMNFHEIIGQEMDLEDERVPDWFRAIFDEPQVFRRLEVASAGIDMRGLRIKPRVVGLVLLDEATGADERQEIADALRALVEDELAPVDLSEAVAGDQPPAGDEQAEDSEDDDESTIERGSMPTDELVELSVGPQAAQVFAYVRADAEPAYLFISYGLDRQAAQTELAKVAEDARRADATGGARTFLVRAEPVTLVSLATIFEPGVFEPFDVNILAQRVGALVFSVTPKVVGDAQTIRYNFELMRPPSLQ
ncbi:MAG: hypothetical protein ACLFVJ_22930, partial [Persicimonas sp.]